MIDPVVSTPFGQVRGSVREGVTRFLGIPYAAAPFGEARFRAPTPPEAWDGVRDALEFGPTAPSVPLPGSFLAEPAVAGLGCLNLNVWTPDPGAAGLPVLVWLHGGANVTGSSAMPIYDGAAFARRGVVFVSVNYRLGAEGFALLPDAVANRALLDQIAALEWVRDAISAFGGDPGAVTLFGTSAGAGSTLAHVGMNRGLARRAIVQSANARAALTAADASLVTGELARAAGVTPTAAGFAAVAPERLAALSTAVVGDLTADLDPARWGASTVAAAQPFLPVVDGAVLREAPFESVLRGGDVDLLIGTNADELLALAAASLPAGVSHADVAALLGQLGLTAGPVREGATPVEHYADVLTELLFREPVAEIARARPAFVYEFAWPSPLPGVGAAHGIELGFVFGNLGLSGLEGPTPPRELAGRVQSAWVSFAATGDPGWPRYGSDHGVFVFRA
ncbi:carboxylesterase family protein [Amycolatopsis rhabdoformis]|uniref:Carboxylic ester hydrolase n=1 Tax=Amycolatopsis rhabdoformis TaxID=1448059 RepID=A0ABZ1I8K8_9PSEU|nr:carboxylesterase family protein [Amycolatopsis rhabdoformis]WSE30695.1 carboxylesterase family protein [Amycolatopsis rhabdoformis]